MGGVSINVSDDACADEAKQGALASLREHTEASVGPLTVEGDPLTVLAFIGKELVGGLVGKTFYNWLYVDLVWVQEECRRSGIGSRVMKAAERRARERKLNGIYLWTESWQAPLFYTKLGYTQFVEFKNCPPGHSRIGFCKYLA